MTGEGPILAKDEVLAEEDLEEEEGDADKFAHKRVDEKSA